MVLLTLSLSQNPSFVLLALALLRGAEIAWDTESGSQGEMTYGETKGAENVRVELENNIPGKEVNTLPIYRSFRLAERLHTDPFTSSAYAFRDCELVSGCSRHL